MPDKMAQQSLILMIKPLMKFVILIRSISIATACYTSIISFGDSISDTGNLIHISSPQHLPHCAFPPYGNSFFHTPTGRCSNGRLIIDFIAEYLGLPLVPPYFGAKAEDLQWGVNFAVQSATAMDNSFFEEKGIHNPSTNVSLGVELALFRQLLPRLCSTTSSCNEFLGSSLVVMGEIGGNDYNHPFLRGLSPDEVTEFVPLVVTTIGSAVKLADAGRGLSSSGAALKLMAGGGSVSRALKLEEEDESLEIIELGAKTILVPGNFPIGCSPAYLTFFNASNKEDYDSSTGCINWLNDFSQYHNELLQNKLHYIQELHPDVRIIYADYYNAAMRLYRSPHEFGFVERDALKACCGSGGIYNFDGSSGNCGYSFTTSCDKPSSYISWDGLHYTEAAYRLIAMAILEGPFSNPPFKSSLWGDATCINSL